MKNMIFCVAVVAAAATGSAGVNSWLLESDPVRGAVSGAASAAVLLFIYWRAQILQ